jgi:hypothetical protein
MINRFLLSSVELMENRTRNEVPSMHYAKWLFAVSLALLLVSAPLARRATAQSASDDVPKFIVSGLDAYKSDGPDAALKVLVKGSSLEGSRDALSQANVLRQIQDYYGAYKSFDRISSRTITPTTRVLYLSLNFEKGPLFAKFVIYRADSGWILVNFVFNTKEELILPSTP